MKKIIVAGAGHGGLTAAFILSQKGYDVTVVERKNPETIGYDWHDCLDKSIFSQTGFDEPDEREYIRFSDMRYYSEKKNVFLFSNKSRFKNIVYLDRNVLLNCLISQCEKAGVKFIFDARILGAVCENGRVSGIKFRRESEEEIFGDLIIDAAGIDSPVRKTLPQNFGVKNSFSDGEIFYTYRAYYENKTGSVPPIEANVYFYHCKRKGMDWAIFSKKYVDILVGSLNELTEAGVEESLGDFRKEYPFIGEKILRGGSFEKIPLGKMIPKCVCNSYAAVGNSASMTEPLCGSGINKSMYAGLLLAKTVTEIGDKPFTQENLWKYQYSFYSEVLNPILNDNAAKNLLMNVGYGGINVLFEKKILTAKEIDPGAFSGYELKDYLYKAAGVLTSPYLLKYLIKYLADGRKIQKICASFPEEYDEEKFLLWAQKYEKL